MSDVLHCAYLLSFRTCLCALIILCPVYHLHTSHVIMIFVAEGELNEIPIGPDSSAPPLQGIVAHTSSLALRLLPLTVAACRVEVLQQKWNETLLWKNAISLHIIAFLSSRLP